MAGSVTWNGDAAMKKLKAEMGRRLDACGILTTNHVRQMISIEGAGKATGKRGKLIYGANPSAPGSPPHKQTGRLAASMAWERDGLVARVGTAVKYGPWLEMGTSRMAARPFLHRALNEMTPRIRAILSKPMDF